MIEFEADDAIATAAARTAADPRVDQVRIAAVDKDMCQCVIGTRVVRWDRWKDVIARRGRRDREARRRAANRSRTGSRSSAIPPTASRASPAGARARRARC